MMKQHAVVVAGGGPTGLMLAGELALAGIDIGLVDRRTTQDLLGARAGGLQSRTIEVLDQRGIADRFLAEGQPAQTIGFGGVKLDISTFPARYPYGLGLWQKHIERILAGWIAELPVTVYRGREITGFSQDEAGVTVLLSGGEAMRAQYLVGCDGGRSVIRRTAGIDFPGWPATMSSIIAEVETLEPPPLGIQQSPHGAYGFGRLNYQIVDGQLVFADEGPVRVMVPERDLGATGEPTLEELRAALIFVVGKDYGIHSPTSISRFTDATRQAARYRSGRVLLAGDAAHIHSPVGGQGLNIGVQDAVNLGWKLAQVVKGISSESLLDTYHAERHPVGARVLRTSMAQVALQRQDDRTRALRETVAEFLAMDEPRLQMAAELSGLGIQYDLGAGHPLCGRRMPDLELITTDGPRRLFTLLHEARTVLLDLGTTEMIDLSPWTGYLRHVPATYTGPWQLPVLGEVAPPTTVLIRPDGYVAWVGESSLEGLREALTSWCGNPAGS